jgi:hypothetical protein
MVLRNKFKFQDKVKEPKGSFIYVVKNYHYDEELGTTIYELESIDSGYIKYLPEEDLQIVSWGGAI